VNIVIYVEKGSLALLLAVLAEGGWQKQGANPSLQQSLRSLPAWLGGLLTLLPEEISFRLTHVTTTEKLWIVWCGGNGALPAQAPISRSCSGSDTIHEGPLQPGWREKPNLAVSILWSLFCTLFTWNRICSCPGMMCIWQPKWLLGCGQPGVQPQCNHWGTALAVL